MWKTIHKKLHSHSGESLAEVLVALLIIALSSMLLVAMISTASSMDIATRNRDKIFYNDLTLAETQEDSGIGSGNILIIDEASKDEIDKVPVTIYGGHGLISYKKSATANQGGGS